MKLFSVRKLKYGYLRYYKGIILSLSDVVNANRIDFHNKNGNINHHVRIYKWVIYSIRLLGVIEYVNDIVEVKIN